MKFFHMSDLHIGKHLHYYNLKEEQMNILGQVAEKAKELHPDAIVIAGDIYDKTSPSAEAVSIFNQFLTELSDISPAIPVLIISGNHDSAERLNYASSILDRHHIHIAGMPPQSEEELIKTVTLEDEYGKVRFYLLPFIKPGNVRNLLRGQEKEAETYDDAVRMLIAREKIDLSVRNVIVSHQFYTSGGKEPDRSASETVTVGGIDSVDISALESFDYAALGHIHKAQKVHKNSRYYSGTLMKYSVSEYKDEKNLKMIELREKGTEPIVHHIPVEPLRDVRIERGLLEEIIEKADEKNRDDYISITVTDEVTPYRLRERLEDVYSHILEVKADNVRTRTKISGEAEDVDVSDPLEVFRTFFHKIQGRSMNEEEMLAIARIIEEER